MNSQAKVCKQLLIGNKPLQVWRKTQPPEIRCPHEPQRTEEDTGGEEAAYLPLGDTFPYMFH